MALQTKAMLQRMRRIALACICLSCALCGARCDGSDPTVESNKRVLNEDFLRDILFFPQQTLVQFCNNAGSKESYSTWTATSSASCVFDERVYPGALPGACTGFREDGGSIRISINGTCAADAINLPPGGTLLLRTYVTCTTTATEIRCEFSSGGGQTISR